VAQNAGIDNSLPLASGIAEIEAMARGDQDFLQLSIPGAEILAKLMTATARRNRPFYYVHRVFRVARSAILGVIEGVRTQLAELVSELVRTMPANQERADQSAGGQRPALPHHGQRGTGYGEHQHRIRLLDEHGVDRSFGRAGGRALFVCWPPRPNGIAEGSMLLRRSRRYVVDDRPVQQATSFRATNRAASPRATPPTSPPPAHGSVSVIGVSQPLDDITNPPEQSCRDATCDANQRLTRWLGATAVPGWVGVVAGRGCWQRCRPSLQGGG